MNRSIHTKIKLLAILLATILLTLVACASNPKMTVKEYAVACGAVANEINGITATFERTDVTSINIDALESTLEDTKREVQEWNPPEELQDFHKINVKTFETSFGLVQELLDLMRDMQKATEEDDQDRILEIQDGALTLYMRMMQELSDIDGEYERELNALSPETSRLLAQQGC